MDVEARYSHLKELAATIPNFGTKGAPNRSPECLEWLGRLYALLDDPMFHHDAITIQVSSDSLGGLIHEQNVTSIVSALYRAIGKIELVLPSSSRGAFIPAGNAFDALSAASKIVEEAKNSLLIVDPYLGPKILEKFAIQAGEGVQIHLLGAKGRIKSGLEPSAKAWLDQFGTARPLSLRVAESRYLHDRLIIVDRATVWDISQSFEDLAARSPATLSKSSAETAVMKVDAYSDLFAQSEVII